MILTVKNRSALLDKTLRLVESDTTKDFFTYFDFQCQYVADYVHPDEKEQFIDLITGKYDKSDNRSNVFRLLRNNGEYCYNFVTVRNVPEPNLARIRLFDIYDAIEFTRLAVDENNKIHAALSLTNDYIFSYQKSKDLFTIAYYSQGQEIVLHKMHLADWKKLVIEERLVSPENVKSLNFLCEDIAKSPDHIMDRIEGSFRTAGAVQEKLRFVGMRHEGLNDTYLVGRILSDEDIAKIQHSHALINELQLDSLTQVYNKKTITSYIEQKFKSGLDNHFAIMIVDLDHFKPVNDKYGHMAGDKVIARSAQKIKEIIGEDGVVGRFGGDEFVVVLDNVANVNILRGVLRALVVQIKKEFEGDFEDIDLTCSVGAAVYPTNGTTYDEIFKKADFCLYRAKDKGRNRYVFYRDDLHSQAYAERLKETGGGKASESRDVQELGHMTRFMRNLAVNPKTALDTLLKHMMGLYSVDCICIYAGKKMKRIVNYGEDYPELKSAEYVFSDDFKKLVDDNGTALFNLIYDVPEGNLFRTVLEERKIYSTVHCIIGTKDNIKGLITFNKLNVPIRFADYEVSCANLLAASLSFVDLKKLC